MSERGASFIELVLGSAVLCIVLLSFLALLVDFNMRSAQLEADVLIGQDVGEALAELSIQGPCERFVTEALGALPAVPSGILHAAPALAVRGVRVPVGADFGARNRGTLKGAALVIDGVIMPGQNVVRGRFVIDYEIKAGQGLPLLKRSRTQSVFLGLDGAGSVTSCFDSKSLRAYEWAESVCGRLGGTTDPAGRCDLSASPLVREQTCRSLGFQLVGSECG